MPLFGLIGKSLSHSFSKDYFTNKFNELGIDSTYELFELDSIDKFERLKKLANLKGLNITIPYKQSVIPFLDEIDQIAEQIGAVNTITFKNGRTKGYNSDYFGFKESLENFIPNNNIKALILGTGGASKAVQKALRDLDIDFNLISRIEKENQLTYSDLTDALLLKHKLIINTTPLGMYPNSDYCPPINYDCITKEHFCFDLIYNPEITLFMNKSAIQGAKVKNGLEMLRLQAEKSWEIWNN